MSRRTVDVLIQQARTQPEALALLDASEAWTYAQLEAATYRLAMALRERGLGDGARIATLLDDASPAVTLIHAARRCGAVLMPLNRRSAPAELRQQLFAAHAVALIHDSSARTLALAAATSGQRTPTVHIDELRRDDGSAARTGGVREDVDLTAPATILFTSGSSARPKAALLTHANHAASADAWATLLEPRAGDRWLACLPLYHVAGLAMVMRAVRWGVALEIHAGFGAAAVAASLGRGVTHLSLVPTLLDELLDDLEGGPRPRALRAILLGGGPIPGSLLARARSAGLPVITTYGMTETASGVAAGGAIVSPDAPASVLQPLSGVEVRVMPGDGGIQIRGDMVFSGYLDADGNTIDERRDGWFDSGDLGELDTDGRLLVSDRRADLLISGGENVYPAEVEAVLLQHRAVRDAAVVARRDERWGAVPVAFVVMEPGPSPSDATLAAHCAAHLAGFKVPVAFDRRRSLPRNESGKLMRGQLRETLSEEFD